MASERFLEALRRSHVAVAKVEVLNPSGSGSVIVSSDDADPLIQVGSGVVSVDVNAQTRRSANIEVLNVSAVPMAVSSLLSASSNNELRLYRGIRFPEGDVEYVLLGTFGITYSTVDDYPDRFGIGMDLADRTEAVRGARLTTPYTVASGTDGIAAIEAFILSRYPSATFRSISTVHTLPAMSFDEQSDPWEAVEDMSEAIGVECYAAPDGVFELREVPNAGGVAVAFDYAEGEFSVLAGVTARTQAPRYNGVIFSGEALETGAAPVRGEAWDDDPNSPSYRLGPFGERPYFDSSPIMTTQAMVDAAALTVLRKIVGSYQSIEFASAVVNPTLEGRDVVRLVRARAGLDLYGTLDRFNIPLTTESGAMQCAIRERRVT